MTEQFNPYYVAPKSQYGKINIDMGKVNSGLQSASVLAGDITELSKKGTTFSYQSNNGAYKPSMDYMGGQNQLKEMQSLANGGTMRTIGDVGKYASSGAAFGPVGALIGGAVGLGIGVAKQNKLNNDAAMFGQSLKISNDAYNKDLMQYNINQGQSEMNDMRRDKYAIKNPYHAPSSTYWY